MVHVLCHIDHKEPAVAKKKKTGVLYRAVQFEIRPSAAEEQILWAISSNLASVWNEALAERTRVYDEFLAPLYAEIKGATDEAMIKAIKGDIRRVLKDHQITLFDQINALTPRRDADESFAAVPRNWQEETLDMLNGDFKSFFALRKGGDWDARPPGARKEGWFCEITGRMGFGVRPKSDSLTIRVHELMTHSLRDTARLESDSTLLVLSCRNLSKDSLAFPIPAYQAEKLAQTDKVKKFTLFRDERDAEKPGRFWVSLVYEIEKPEQKPFVPEEAVYVALGASYLGVVSPDHEEVIKFWRPDKHWQPRIENVKKRIKELPSRDLSRWEKRNVARRIMEKIKARQQKQNHREIVNRLLAQGTHFVVSEMVIRSKEGALADRSKKERGGVLGLNWSAQNTGSIAEFVAWLRIKAAEHGGTVQAHRLPHFPKSEGVGADNKIALARALREGFLSTCSS